MLFVISPQFACGCPKKESGRRMSVGSGWMVLCRTGFGFGGELLIINYALGLCVWTVLVGLKVHCPSALLFIIFFSLELLCFVLVPVAACI